jgi:hypothetical protein
LPFKNFDACVKSVLFVLNFCTFGFGDYTNNLSRIELGKFNIGADTLHKIAEALDLKLDFMPTAPNPHQKPE